MINILTIPAYITINKKEKPMSTGKFTKVKREANKIKQMGTPRIYQYNKAVVFLNGSLSIFFPLKSTVS